MIHPWLIIHWGCESVNWDLYVHIYKTGHHFEDMGKTLWGVQLVENSCGSITENKIVL